MSTIRVVAIPGSLRQGSYNRAALRAAAEVAPEGVEVEIRELTDIPFYDGDVERDQGFPPSVAELRRAVAEADGLLLGSPEYNGSITGVLKNALDWLSRGGADSPLRSKPTAMLGAGGRFGTVGSQLHLRDILIHSGTDLVTSPRVMIDTAPQRFDDELRLDDPRFRDQIVRLMEELTAKARRSVPAAG